MHTILEFLFGAAAIVVGGSMLIIVICLLFMFLHFIGTMLLNPFVYLFTGHNLKAYEEYRDMPCEDDFFQEVLVK